MNKIKVLIVDDSALIRNIVREILSHDEQIEVVGEAEDPFVARELIKKHQPDLLTLDPDVLIVTGDHSTPAVLKGHSWHPVPVLLNSKYCRTDRTDTFSEASCLLGGLGRISSVDIIALAMANALKLKKFGA